MAYIYEYIRTRGYEPMHFEEHYARLEALAYSLTRASFALTPEELRAAIAESLHREGMSRATTNALCVRYHDNRMVEVEVVEMLYDELSLRAVRPQGYICHLCGELLCANTSAKEEMLALNYAMNADCALPMWVGEGEELLAIDGAGVVAVFENEIRFSEHIESVEIDLAYRAAAMLHRTIRKGAITLAELADAKELLAIDYRGITAIAGWEGHRYMDITAERLSALMAASER